MRITLFEQDKYYKGPELLSNEATQPHDLATDV